MSGLDNARLFVAQRLPALGPVDHVLLAIAIVAASCVSDHYARALVAAVEQARQR